MEERSHNELIEVDTGIVVEYLASQVAGQAIEIAKLQARIEQLQAELVVVALGSGQNNFKDET